MLPGKMPFEKRRVSDNTIKPEERMKLEDDYFREVYENKDKQA